MADIRPFRAIRPVKGMESRIAALPYDVYSRKEAKAAVADAPHSFLRIDRAASISSFPHYGSPYCEDLLTH